MSLAAAGGTKGKERAVHMVTFRLSREGRDITLNPSKVLYVCHYETGVTSVHFGKECFVRVCGETAEVVAKIEAGLCDRGFDVAAPSSGRTDAVRRQLGLRVLEAYGLFSTTAAQAPRCVTGFRKR